MLINTHFRHKMPDDQTLKTWKKTRITIEKKKTILIHLLWRKFHYLTEVKQGFLQYFWHFFLFSPWHVKRKNSIQKVNFILEKEEIRWLCNIIFNIVITGYDLEEADMKTHAFWDFVYERLPNKKSLKPSIEGRYMQRLFRICLNKF